MIPADGLVYKRGILNKNSEKSPLKYYLIWQFSTELFFLNVKNNKLNCIHFCFLICRLLNPFVVLVYTGRFYSTIFHAYFLTNKISARVDKWQGYVQRSFLKVVFKHLKVSYVVLMSTCVLACFKRTQKLLVPSEIFCIR